MRKKSLAIMFCSLLLLSHPAYALAAEIPSAGADRLSEAPSLSAEENEASLQSSSEDASILSERAPEENPEAVLETVPDPDALTEEEALPPGEVTGYPMTFFPEESEEVLLKYPYTAPAADPYAAMMAMQTQYPEGMPWTNADTYVSSGRLYNENYQMMMGYSGAGCHGFALILSDAAFGSLPIVEHTDFSDLHVGDAIRLNYDTHTVMVTAINGDTLTLAEGNFNSSIHWGGTISRTDTRGWTNIITRRKIDISNMEAVTSSNAIPYDGTAKTPSVYISGLTEDSDFRVVSYNNNINPGTATVTIEGINNFTGRKKVPFTISKVNQNISISVSSVEEGETMQIQVSGAKTPLSFQSSDKSIATVDRNGLVTGVKSGYVTITITATENATYKSSERTIRLYVQPGDKVRAFVRRMYQVALGRSPSGAEADGWIDDLKSGRKTGADIAQGFYMSPEIFSTNPSSEEYVELAYQGMMDRASDAGGKADWVEALDSGVTCNAIIRGFVGSQEFHNLCTDYGIQPGEVTVTEPRDQNVGITKFVARLYTQALGRSYDVGGLNDWTSQILANPSKANILNIATNGFLNSQEFLNKGLSDEDFVRVMYRTFLGREADPDGLNDWLNRMANGASRDEVAAGFANSVEFANIMAQYGL